MPQNTYSVYLGHFSSLFFAKIRALDDLKTASNIEETTQAITEISSSVFCEKKTFKEPIYLLNMGLILLSTTLLHLKRIQIFWSLLIKSLSNFVKSKMMLHNQNCTIIYYQKFSMP